MKIDLTHFTKKKFHQILSIGISIFLLCILLSIVPHSVDAGDGDPTVNFYVERELNGHTQEITALSWSYNGLWIASGSSDNSTKIWSTSNWNSVRTFNHPAPVNEVSWSKNTQRLAISFGNGSIDIYNSVGWGLMENLTQHPEDVRALDWNPAGSSMASGDDSGVVEIWETSSWSSVETLGMPGGVTDLKWSNTGTKLAACSDDGTIKVWDTTTWMELRSFDVTSGDGSTESIAWSPDDSLLASSSGDDLVRVWNTISWNAAQIKNTNGPSELDWGDDGSYLAVGTIGGIKIWDASSWEEIPIKEISGNSQVTSISFNPDGQKITSNFPSEENNTVLIWEKNLSPVLDTIGNIDALEDEPFTYTVTASDDDTLTFYEDSDLFDIDPDSGHISFTPTNDYVGDYEITISVDDGKGGVDSETITFTVINVDDPPEPVFNWRYGADYINITLRVAGDPGNSVSLKIMENGTQIEELVVVKGSGNLEEETLNLPMDIFRTYNMSLEFQGESGDNPVALSLERAGIIITNHFLLGSGAFSSQTVDVDLEYYFKSMGIVILDGSQSRDIDSEIVEYKWFLGDGSTKYGEAILHNYSDHGLYNVDFILKSDNGVNRSISKDIPIYYILTQELINNNLYDHSTLSYLYATDQIAISWEWSGSLLIEDDRGRIVGYVDNEFISEIKDVDHIFNNKFSKVYYVPNGTEYILNLHNDINGPDLMIMRSYGDFKRIITIWLGPGEMALRFSEAEDSFSIFTDEMSMEYDLSISSRSRNSRPIYLKNINITNNEVHHYTIHNWEDITSEMSVSLGIDKDKDGDVDYNIDLKDGMTGEEIQIIIKNMGKSSSPFLTTSMMLLIVGFIGLTGFGFILAGTEVGKLAFLALILPLYTRLKKGEVLDNEIRGMIRGYIIANPGDNYNSIKRALGLNNGALAYHLKVLEKAKIIKSRQNGMYKRFYPASMNIPMENGHQISEIQRLVLNKAMESPGISQKEIAKLLGLSKGVINYHVKILHGKNMLKMEKRGRRTHCYAKSDIVDEIRNKDNENKR